MNILVLCTGNSARSILLESILNRFGEGRVTAWSAGSKPAGQVHPQSLRLLQAKGFDTSAARSKSWDEFEGPQAPVMDAVITVCGSAASEPCPIWPGAPVRAHWGVEDPAAADEADWDVAFETAYAQLKRRADAFLALDFETLDADKLRDRMNLIGQD
ncbi:arsenate reductase ArsC [Loktanella sp. IMCC34160]|uniref:arsenate reductase ArsC n=1 Tax=Loktanella sp. IMCC34160 TaxID=2510646 RepID=UPI00101C9790|nr:arsenate reductase ArsC [Loktanella sp. IMCC34160]RYG92144.1 arsenate reductase ArsC [Loktanella sp. IMCC34160]